MGYEARAGTRSSTTAVAVVGAGPFGLSVAAHLRRAGVDVRIFGHPMSRWRWQMPRDMLLKSEGCGSNLSDPAGAHTLERYCRDEGLPYGDWAKPVSRETFTRYALEFQRRLVPDVEEVLVEAIDGTTNGFALRLQDGKVLSARNVIVATGMDYTVRVPEALADLPGELRSHSSEHFDLARFKGEDVVVIGGGQSALETAAILAEQGASVRLVVRERSLAWNPVPDLSPRSFYERIRYPRTGLGEGLRYWVYSTVPAAFYHLPRSMRLAQVATVLGPAGAWWLERRVVGKLPILLGRSVRAAQARGSRVVLQLSGNGRSEELTTDHVIAATGYRFDLRRLPFLTEDLRSRLRHEDRLPRLSPSFESSVPGLYFTGLASTNSFGPLMRFLHGTGCTARRISTRIAAELRGK